MNSPSLSLFLSCFLDVCACVYVCVCVWDTVHENRVGVRAIWFIPSLNLCRLHAHPHITATSVYGKFGSQVLPCPVFTQLIYFSPCWLIGLPFSSAWAVSDSRLLPSRSVILTQVSASASPSTHTHTQIFTDHGSHDLTAFPLLSVRLILLLWFLRYSPPLPFRVFFFSISEEDRVAQAHVFVLLCLLFLLSPRSFCVSINIASSV